MDLKELKEKYIKLRILKPTQGEMLKECLEALPTDGLNELYEFYDVFKEKKKTKGAKITYLKREIPSQFLDDFRFMMDDEERKKFIAICNRENIEIDSDIVHLLEYGFVYINSENQLIVPDELYYFMTDLF